MFSLPLDYLVLVAFRNIKATRSVDYFFIFLWKAYGPVNRIVTPPGFSLVQILTKVGLHGIRIRLS